MTPRRWQRVKSLMLATLEQPTAARGAFLEAACAGDESLLCEVESLLAADRAAAGFLEEPVRRTPSDGGPRLTAGDRVGPYEVIRELGRGGMGAVYLAVRTEDEYANRVALKVLRPEVASAEIARRLRTEGRMLADLRHPNIARLLDGGTTADGSPYLVLEWVEGEPIDRYCTVRRLPVPERLRLFRKVCAAVAFAHGKLIVHRDLKPSNILVTADGDPKLLDFGIAKWLRPTPWDEDAPTTGLGPRPMTPEYAAPEQLRGAAISTATDVYSLGLVLHRLLTGELPATTASHRLAAALGEHGQALPFATPPRQAGSSSQLRGDLGHIVAKALREEPERRYASVEQLAEDLLRHLEGRPVEARRGSSLYRWGKLLRRHGLALGTVLAAILLLLAFSWTVWLEKQATARQRDRAERVSEFLVEMFQAADPARARGATITAREILDHGAQRLQDGLEDDVGLRAALLETVGRVKMSLSLYGEARQLLEEAVELRRRHFGEESLETAASLDLLGRLLQLQGEYAAAEELHRQVLEIRREELPENSLELARTLDRLGAALFYQTRLEEAEKHYREALAIHERAGTTTGDGLPGLIFNLSVALAHQGKLEASEALCRRALELQRQGQGEGHPLRASILEHLAHLRHGRGDLEEAEALARQALEARRKIFDGDHYDLAQSLNSLGQVLKHQGRFAEAESLYRESLAMARRLLGDDHPDVAVALNNLAVLLHTSGEPSRAEPYYREALAIHRRVFGNEHSSVANKLNNLAFLLADLGDCREAERLHREALALRRRLFGPEHPHVANSLANLGIVLAAQGRLDAAEDAYQEAARLLRDAFGNAHPQVAAVLTNWAALLLQREDWEAAEDLARAALDAFSGSPSRDPRQRAVALGVLAAALEGLGREAEAAPFLQESRRLRPGMSDPRTAALRHCR